MLPRATFEPLPSLLGAPALSRFVLRLLHQLKCFVDQVYLWLSMFDSVILQDGLAESRYWRFAYCFCSCRDLELRSWSNPESAKAQVVQLDLHAWPQHPHLPVRSSTEALKYLSVQFMYGSEASHQWCKQISELGRGKFSNPEARFGFVCSLCIADTVPQAATTPLYSKAPSNAVS